MKKHPVKHRVFRMTLTVAPESVGCLPESIDFITGNFQPEKIQAEPLFLEGRAKNIHSRRKGDENFVRRFIQAFRIAEERGVHLFYSGAQPDIFTTRFCLAACRAFVVTPEGHVTTCFEIFGKHHRLGERFIVGSFDGDKFVMDTARLRRVFRRTVDSLDFCRDCFCKWHCAGDCAAKEGSRCFINQEIMKYFLLDRIRKSGGLIWSGNTA